MNIDKFEESYKSFEIEVIELKGEWCYEIKPIKDLQGIPDLYQSSSGMDTANEAMSAAKVRIDWIIDTQIRQLEHKLKILKELK